MGTVGQDVVILNEKSLWSGGPFQDSVSGLQPGGGCECL